jgi:threonine dehydrogenase-like Zn-dependent dehydrogenase
MRAITVRPGVPNSAELRDMPEPQIAEGAILARTLALGVCGTDREIVDGDYGAAPEGADRLILGHESFGEVIEAPAGSGFSKGDHVVGVVRRPDPVPCPACAVGEWDMCRNGGYTERGIKGRHGYGAEFFRIEPDFALKIDPALGMHGVLMEPTSIVAKGWDHAERIGHRTHSWNAKTLLVTGAGPVGLLAAMMGKQRGLDIHVLDHNDRGPKRKLVETLGGTFHLNRDIVDEVKPDIVMECTGASDVIAHLLGRIGPSGIICLAGLSPGKHEETIDLGFVNSTMVLNNHTVFGTVNANLHHYEMAAEALMKADKNWLAQLITRRVPLSRWQDALKRAPGDIKVVVDFTQ